MMIDYTRQQIGNYRLVRQLGIGGFASVYQGQHVHIANRQVAIKILHLSDVDTQKFQHEAATMASLEHPNILRLIDFSFFNAIPFLVMDYAPGGSLRMRHPTEHSSRLPQWLSISRSWQVPSNTPITTISFIVTSSPQISLLALTRNSD